MALKERLEAIYALDYKRQRLEELKVKAEKSKEMAQIVHVQLYELERAKDILDSNYYWARHRELTESFLGIIK
jgi:hypothetical protein